MQELHLYAMVNAELHGLDRLLLRRWRRDAALSRAQAAGELGISTRMLAYYEDGVHDVPRAVVLAVRKLASDAGIRLPGDGIGRDRWVMTVERAVAYGRGEAVVGGLIREGKHAELRDLLQLLTQGPPSEMALTDPALFRALRDAGIRAMLSGLCTLKVRLPPSKPINAAPDANELSVPSFTS